MLKSKALLVFAAIGFNERVEAGEWRVPRETSLYLDFFVTGQSADRAEEVLTAALDAAPIASVLLRGEIEKAGSLAKLVQRRGIALLSADASTLSKALTSDGLHLGWSDDVVQRFKDARRDAVAGAIIGADAGRSRHDAMELGEAGADYVAFGIPPHVGDRVRAAERQLDLVQWWSELFEVPCVAFDVADAPGAAQLADAGADFIAVTLRSDSTPEHARAILRAFAEAISLREPAR